MKCRVCREPAVIDIRRHNANFCAEHFLRLCRDQVTKAIDRFAMLAPVAGKSSTIIASRPTDRFVAE